MYFSIKKFIFFFISYFKAIQTAVLIIKTRTKSLGLIFSCFYTKPMGCLATKIRVKVKENWPSKSSLKKLVGWIVKALEIAKEAGQFHVFHTFLKYVLGSSEAI